jgi:methionyl-tRNA formyltransferase
MKDWMKMKCALVGSRFFGASVFEALRKEEGIEFTSVVAPAEDDRLALAARAAGVTLHRAPISSLPHTRTRE